MHFLLFSSLLGAGCVVQDAAAEKTDSLEAVVTVWPPGSNLHLGETVLLLCSIQPNSSSCSFGTYRWFRDTPLSELTSGPRFRIHEGSLFIRRVSRQDQGRYWCQAEHREGGRTKEIQSQTVDLKVRAYCLGGVLHSGCPLFHTECSSGIDGWVKCRGCISLRGSIKYLTPKRDKCLIIMTDSPGRTVAMAPDSRHVFKGERFTFLCPDSTTDPSAWRLKHFSLDGGVTSSDLNADNCTSPLGGAVTSHETDGSVFSAVNGSSGLYWCESPEERTNAVNVTVSSASVIIKTPVSPVPEGHTVTLYCQYQTGSPSRTSFYKNGEIIPTATTTVSNKSIMMTVDNVTQEDEGFYKCMSEDQALESEESWLSVQADEVNSTTADGAADVINGDHGWWILVSCGVVVLFLIPVSVCLLWLRSKAKCSCNHRPLDTQDVPAAELPVTKQDITEVQWDLSWMEMTNLLDKNLYPGT